MIVRLPAWKMAEVEERAAAVLRDCRSRGARSEYGRHERVVDNHVIGDVGECAAAMALDLPWTKGGYGASDVGRSVEVRTRLLPGKEDLILMRSDKPKINKYWVLCHVFLNGTNISNTVHVVGWILGREGMKRHFWYDLQRYKPHGVCFVPPDSLNPIDDLREILSERQAPAAGRSDPVAARFAR